MKIGVFGIGAIGTVVSTRLSKNVRPYYFNRSQKQKLQLKFQDQFFEESIILSSVSTEYQLDWLLICLKEYQYLAAVLVLKKLITNNTKVAILRNGLDLEASISGLVKNELILPCMINAPTQLNHLQQFELFSFPEIIIPKNHLSNSFISIFDKSKINIKNSNDFKTANWKKLIESASLGSIMCLNDNTAQILKEVKYLNYYKQLIAEGITIAKKDGANIEDDFFSRLIVKLVSYNDHKGSSMLTDKRLGRKIEVNAKNGAIVKVAKRLGIEAPKHQEMLIELNDLNAGRSE